MKKIIAGIILIGAVALAGEKVYVVMNGKSYHKTDKCRTLSRSRNIIEMNRSEVRNLDPCKVCY